MQSSQPVILSDFETFFAYRGRTADAMRMYGGGFVSALAATLIKADTSNARKIYDTWPEIIRDFGPGSRFFEVTPR